MKTYTFKRGGGMCHFLHSSLINIIKATAIPIPTAVTSFETLNL